VSIGSSPIIPKSADISRKMQLKKLIQFKKNSKFIRINKLYFDLLKTKHLLSFFVGSLKKKQFLNCYKVSSRKKLYTSFLMKLEFRLEVILLKLGLVVTGKQAKQLILHGQVCINGLIITAYNYQLKLKDFISINRSFILVYK
jgi:ribosomal protein S4